VSIERVRILVVDDDPRVGRDLRARLDSPSFEVLAAQGAGRSLAADALTKAGILRPHVAVVDLQLCDGGSGALEGLKLMSDLRSAGLVLYSGHLRTAIVDQVKQQFRCQVVDKGDDPPSKLIDAIHLSAAEMCGFGQRFTVRYPDQWHPNRIIEALFGPGSGVPEDAVEAVIWQLFQQQLAEAVKIDRVDLESMEGSVRGIRSVSRGHSVLLKAFRRGRIKPLVLKLSTPQSVEHEFQHYKEHVEDNIGGDFYAVVRGRPVHFWNVGGLAYQFLGGKTDDLENLSTCYSATPTGERVLVPLRHFFGVAWRGLYDKTAECDCSLYEVYDDGLHLAERLAAFGHAKDQVAFPGLKGVALPNPLAWVQQHGAQSSHIHSARIAPTHGDLHADNLLVDREHAWAIDFERTGLGHWLRDFAELEVDILTRLVTLPGLNSLQMYGKLIVAMLEPRGFNARPGALLGRQTSPSLAKAVEVIGGLRRIAHRTINCTDFREYLWALLFDAVFVATLPDQTPEQRQRAMLLGAVLCDRLEHWRGAWPLQARVFSTEPEEQLE
jgi:CheY-like chemotaxis protein